MHFFCRKKWNTGIILFVALLITFSLFTIVRSAFVIEAATNEYDQQFEVMRSNITSIENNGGNYGSSTLDKAIDGNPSTHWETGQPNTDTFTNKVTFTFDQVYTLSKIEYLVRQGANWKGFPLHYKLYGSDTASGDNFELLKEDTYIEAQGKLVTFDFPDTDVRRFQLEFIQAKQHWASIAEISFYKPDPLTEELNKVFTDKSYSTLSSDYNNTDAINKLMNQANNHPYKDMYLPILNDALTLVSDPSAFQQKQFTAEQRGNIYKQTSQAQMDNRQTMLPTGYYVTPGETLKVYVDADPNGIMPSLVFGQALTVAGNWKISYELKPGINIIEAPPLATDDSENSKMRPAPIYLENHASPNQQAYAPVIRLVGGTKFPMYIHGQTDVSEFMDNLAKYVENVENNDLYFDYDTIKNSSNPKKYNIMELVTENTITTTSAKAALAGLTEQYNKEGLTIADSAETWEQFFDVMNEYAGLNDDDPNSLHHAPKARLMNRLFTKGPHAWAGGGITGYQSYGDLNNGPRTGGFAKELVMVKGPGGNWGEAHEWGHIYDSHPIEIAEITNNLFSLRMEREFNRTSRLVRENRWDTVQKYNNGENVDFSVFEELATLYQMEVKFGLNDFFPKVNRFLREEVPNNTFAGLTKWQTMAVAMSKVAEIDVTPHFAHNGKDMNNDAVRAFVDGLPVLEDKTWLLTDKARELSTFTNDSRPQITSINRLNTGVELTFDIDEPKHTVLAYEIYRDGESIGISYESTYTDRKEGFNQPHHYEVIAYDGKANASPISLDLVVKDTTIIEGEAIDLRTLISKAMDIEGNDATISVTIDEGDFNVNVPGTYTITFTLGDVVQTATVNVKEEIITDPVVPEEPTDPEESTDPEETEESTNPEQPENPNESVNSDEKVDTEQSNDTNESTTDDTETELPKTNTTTYNNLLIGFILLIAGSGVMLVLRRKA
ncbi:F5/8 type C domain protein [Paraliobacillus sp. PM-2]|uniref:M60 family metallopeptidase n=1 Tax=Paraliobacillus sp. PM-2 TaxID=1462524 RepID=UPI00061C5506|nr:M60 family metallopeptidase [Paraliobacillus sp. PM-2]CQR47148.1 F5/8 type C domain protein [Paraliobacillus sp. PM-2]